MKILYRSDADINAWKYYEKIYKDKIQIDIGKLKNSKGRLNGSFVYENEKLISVDKKYKGNVIMDLSGECLFNFNEKKHKLFMGVIKYSDASDDEKNEAVKELQHCESIFNKYPWNFVLMPVQGAMNNVKGNIYYSINSGKFVAPSTMAGKRFDRPDTFLCFLDDFYQMKNNKCSIKEAGEFLSCSIFSYSLKSFNFSILYEFMAQFDSTEQFCALFWGIDESFVERMRKLGRVPLDSDRSIRKKCNRKEGSIEVMMKYMELAKDYWKIREDQFEKK